MYHDISEDEMYKEKFCWLKIKTKLMKFFSKKKNKIIS